MANKYTKAPLSELILGVLFNSHTLAEGNVLFEVISGLSSQYPEFKSMPAIGEEDLQGYTVVNQMDFDKTGFSLYRLVSDDSNWVIQLQQNYLSLHWVRGDGKAVGEYPGFDAVYKRFMSVFSFIKELYSKGRDDFNNQIKYFSLHYQDRIFWEEYSENNLIDNLLTINFPFYPTNNINIHPNNVFSKYTFPYDEIGGYGTVTINTGTTPYSNKQMLVIENRVKGKIENIEEWFKKAHTIQVDFFENIFSQKVLELWK
ncbi:MAG: TIGR04255 family protein [Bacteroidetes bacterium]|nr:TIGR04255 family protein [Bacteroidota bacterium]